MVREMISKMKNEKIGKPLGSVSKILILMNDARNKMKPELTNQAK